MNKLGLKDMCIGTSLLNPLYGPVGLPISNRPTEFPSLDEGAVIICGYDEGSGENLIICENLEEMQTLYDRYSDGWAINIQWYTCKQPGSIYVLGTSKTKAE